MKKNPVVPYAIIAVLGIVAMIILAGIGVNQMNEAKGDNGEAVEENGGESVSTDPEGIFQNNCSACHGADLAGNVGPALNKIGAKLSQDDILNTIKNGKGIMQPGIIQGEEAQLVAEWLASHK